MLEENTLVYRIFRSLYITLFFIMVNVIHSVMVENLHMWIGSTEIQESEDRITIPQKVSELNIVESEMPVHWMIWYEKGEVVISKEVMKDGGQKLVKSSNQPSFKRVTHTTLSKNRTTAVPKRFFSDYEGKAKGSKPIKKPLRFNRNIKCHFITSIRLLKHRACLIIQEDTPIIEILEQGSDRLIPDGGEEQDDSSSGIGLGDDRVLILERGTKISIETAKSLAKEFSHDPDETSGHNPDETSDVIRSPVDKEEHMVFVTNMDTVDDISRGKIQTALKEVINKYQKLQVLHSHVRFLEQKEKLRGTPLVQCDIHLRTDHGPISGTGEGYGGEQAFHVARNKLERNMIEMKGTRNDVESNSHTRGKSDETY